jgi:hypothetical protein
LVSKLNCYLIWMYYYDSNPVDNDPSLQKL